MSLGPQVGIRTDCPRLSMLDGHSATEVAELAEVGLDYMQVAQVVVAVPLAVRSRLVVAVPADYSGCAHKSV